MRDRPVVDMGWQGTMARIPRGYRVNIVLYMLTALSLVALLGELAFGNSDGDGGEFATAMVPTTTTIPRVTTSTTPIVTTPLPPAQDEPASSRPTATTRFRSTAVVTQPPFDPEPEPEPEPEEPPVVTLPPTTEPESTTVPPTTKKPGTTTTTSKKNTTTTEPPPTTKKKN